jgi:phage major head subunit gpT-like protein
MRVTPVAKTHLDALLSGLNLAVQPGLDPDPINAVAVATFTYTTPAGQTQQVRGPFPRAQGWAGVLVYCSGAGPGL